MFAKRLSRCFFLILLVVSAQSFAVPKIEHWTTARGGRVYFVPTQGLPLVDVRLVFDAGSARDGAKFGLAALTSGLLDTGAGDWDADAIAQRLENVGANLATGAARDSAFVSLRSLTHPEKLGVALETAKEVLAHPRFDPKDLDREKSRTLLAIKQRGEEPDELVDIAFMKALYGDHPYAHPAEGFTETVQPLTREDLVDFHKRLYVVKNAIVVIVGDVKRAEAETMADTLLSGLPDGEAQPPLPDPVPNKTPEPVKTAFPSEQTHVLAGQLGMKVNDPDYFALYVGNHILGGSGLVSRVSMEVREKRGFAYSAYSYFYPQRVAGPFEIGLQTRNDKAEEAVQVAIKTVKDFVEQGPTDKELEASKQNIVGGFVLRLDSNQKLTGEVASIAFYNRPLDYLDTFTQKVQAVTKDDIKRAFKARIDPDHLQTVLVGGAVK
ncbi:M16 family metallopeptidase [Methylomagnum ishizawai]|uniref:M16 family metallopeptidase n=1 Tax=Methylomagnum ishizawai TaxID=1760988 RepID=UPI001C3301A3|nr:pitrilysin family protein [Methylomagnum ishizawai]BBL76434.1 peptidase M16 [Methylomagnum ishizawai]